MPTTHELPESSRSHIRSWRALAVLFIIALFVAGYIHFVIYGVTLGPRSWGRGLGEFLGAALSLVALPAIVIVPWRLIQRRLGTVTNAPLVVGTVLFLIYAGLMLRGATTD
jgi:hypothetical protein